MLYYAMVVFPVLIKREFDHTTNAAQQEVTRPLTCVAGVAAVAGHARARERVDAVIAGAAVGARFWAALVDVCTRRGSTWLLSPHAPTW